MDNLRDSVNLEGGVPLGGPQNHEQPQMPGQLDPNVPNAPLPRDDAVRGQVNQPKPKVGAFEALIGAISNNKVLIIGIVASAVGAGCCLAACALGGPLVFAILGALIFGGGVVLTMAAPIFEEAFNEFLASISANPVEERNEKIRQENSNLRAENNEMRQLLAGRDNPAHAPEDELPAPGHELPAPALVAPPPDRHVLQPPVDGIDQARPRLNVGQHRGGGVQDVPLPADRESHVAPVLEHGVGVIHSAAENLANVELRHESLNAWGAA